LVRVYPQVRVFKARRIVHIRASKELLETGERFLERRAAKLEKVLEMWPEIRVASGDVAGTILEVAEEAEEPTPGLPGHR
jgi:hypothetical protein